MSEEIGADEFIERTEAVCIGGSTGLPKRLRDRHILLAGATMWMAPDGVYSEGEVNEALELWLDEGCPSLDLDVATLRRELVDRVYLNRDDSGRHYTAGPGSREVSFAADVAGLDTTGIIAAALTERERRKRDHMSEGKR